MGGNFYLLLLSCFTCTTGLYFIHTTVSLSYPFTTMWTLIAVKITHF